MALFCSMDMKYSPMSDWRGSRFSLFITDLSARPRFLLPTARAIDWIHPQ
jgi:hypothetical protein